MMQVGKFFVKINLETEIFDGDDRQRTTVTSEGELFQTDRQSVVRFTEKNKDQPDVATMITIKPNQLSIKRSGEVEMNQKFDLERTTEMVYRHQFGSLRMETTTHDFKYKPLTTKENAKLTINYTTVLDGEEEREHKLLLTIEEDKS